MPRAAALRNQLSAPAAPGREPSWHLLAVHQIGQTLQQGPLLPGALGRGRAPVQAAPGRDFPPRRCREASKALHSPLRPQPPGNAPGLVATQRAGKPGRRQGGEKADEQDPHCGLEAGPFHRIGRVEEGQAPGATAPLKCGCQAASCRSGFRTPRGNWLPRPGGEPIDGRSLSVAKEPAEGGRAVASRRTPSGFDAHDPPSFATDR